MLCSVDCSYSSPSLSSSVRKLTRCTNTSQRGMQYDATSHRSISTAHSQYHAVTACLDSVWRERKEDRTITKKGTCTTLCIYFTRATPPSQILLSDSVQHARKTTSSVHGEPLSSPNETLWITAQSMGVCRTMFD